jgi:hypothetical protein
MLLCEELVGLLGATSDRSDVTAGKCGAFFHGIDGPVLPCTLKVHVSD